jgi:hypothetical protein
MNARQRRTAYRALPKIGTILEFCRPNRIVMVRVIGRTSNVNLLASTSDDSMYTGERPSVRRVRTETIPGPFETAGRNAPLVSRLRTVPENMRHLILAA